MERSIKNAMKEYYSKIKDYSFFLQTILLIFQVWYWKNIKRQVFN